jgi:hypothetical protein
MKLINASFVVLEAPYEGASALLALDFLRDREAASLSTE